jgi:kynurenine formamidase
VVRATRFLEVEAQELAALFAACSNAGRWGPDDELGTLNLITPATRRRAARLVTEGLSVSMASDLSVQHTLSTDSLTSHTAFTDPAAPIAVADAITLQVHGWSTHLDALGHIYTDEVGYNARRRAEIRTSHGLSANAITALKDGVFTRGVLLDVAASYGLPWLSADHAITRTELEHAEHTAGVTVEAGDALFVHAGLATRLATTPDDPGDDPDHDDTGHRAGLGIDAVLWLRERDVAVFGGDCVELLPGPDPDLPLPLHQLGIGAMGLTLLDWPHLERVLATCMQLQRHEFLFTVAPLPIVGGTGSPVNPIATF